jgi:hypothetical protein
MGRETTIIVRVDPHQRVRRLVMKKAVFLFAAGLLLLAGLPAFSQAQAQTYTKDAYVKTFAVEKVWVDNLGYVVTFFNSHQQVQNIYVPITWFNKGPNSKAEIIYDSSNRFPYVSIFWADGKFDHINLYVLSNYDSPSWGVLIGDYASQFNVQDITLNF